MLSQEFTLGGLFASAFLSSTLLPGGSEIVLATIEVQHQFEPWVLVAVATAGNTLGGMTSWLLGRWIRWRFPDQRLLQPCYAKALARMQKWGSSALLFSWVPIIGDPLCLAAGWLRVNGGVAFIMIGLGKLARYSVLVTMV